ncbi:MAG: TIGR01906 family membrane protein [Bariatricus sp.]|nr:TIGR01906 family membrane protein [Bariatricus sp.]
MANIKQNEKITMTAGLQGFLGALTAISLIFILLITSFEIGAYSDFGFYEKEYEKYKVADQLYMEMDDIMEVTKYMMSYLKGNEETLSIETTVEGNRQDFFNEQDRLHMEDVQGLFLGGIFLRRVAVFLLIFAVMGIILMKGDCKKILPRMYERVLAAFIVVIVVLGLLISKNFTKCFMIFHELFFDNDLWIFDPETDYMIRMLPEGFFFDMVIRIGLIFVGLLLITLIIAVIVQKTDKKISNTYKTV